MAKNTLSLGSLVNLVELNRIIKKSNALYFGNDNNVFYVSNGHWIARLRLPDDATTRATLFGRFGKFPEDGTALHVFADHDVNDFDLDRLKKFFSGTFYCECHDTHLVHDLGDHELRLFHCTDHQLGLECYAAIDRKYFSMVANYARAASAKCSKASPIMFTANYDEAIMILPVNYDPSVYLSRV